MTLIFLFARAFCQVALVAFNVRCIHNGWYARAFVTGFTISLLWWFNANSAAHVPGLAAPLVYALGAATGTLTGMWAGRPR